MTFEDSDSLVFSKTWIPHFKCWRDSAKSLPQPAIVCTERLHRINYWTLEHSSISWMKQGEKSSNLVPTEQKLASFLLKECSSRSTGHLKDSLNLSVMPTGGCGRHSHQHSALCWPSHGELGQVFAFAATFLCAIMKDLSASSVFLASYIHWARLPVPGSSKWFLPLNVPPWCDSTSRNKTSSLLMTD